MKKILKFEVEDKFLRLCVDCQTCTVNNDRFCDILHIENLPLNYRGKLLYSEFIGEEDA